MQVSLLIKSLAIKLALYQEKINNLATSSSIAESIF